MELNRPETFYLKKLFENTKTKEIMTTPVETVIETEDLSVVEDTFIKKNVYYLAVLDDEKKFVGLISQKYLYKAHSPRKISGDNMDYDSQIIIDGDSYYDREKLDQILLYKIMNKNTFTLGPDDTVAMAVTNMAKKNLGCIPIINEKEKILGLLLSHNIIEFSALSLVE